MDATIREAEMARDEHGLCARTEGWFVLNVRDARWSKRGHFGRGCSFEGDVPFEQMGVHLSVLEPGEPVCHYHRENQQEGFLVLSGECVLLVEGEERRLGAWDYVHCPPGTNHVIVGAGSGPCAVLMLGARLPEERLVYPVDELALRHRAGVAEETDDPAVSYAKLPPSEPCGAGWPLEAPRTPFTIR